MSAATLQEIANALKCSKQAVHAKAKSEKWAFDTSPHPGNHRQLFPLATLPAPIRLSVEEHRAAAHVERCAHGLGDWINERRVALTADQREDTTTIGKLLCARALEAQTSLPAPASGRAFSTEALINVLGRRYEMPPVIIQRWIDEAQHWLSRAASPAPQLPIVTLDAHAERRAATAFWRSQIIAPIVRTPRSAPPPSGRCWPGSTSARTANRPR